jgi:TRAP-type C4-dicarboxylate transport system substrate-binding protein
MLKKILGALALTGALVIGGGAGAQEKVALKLSHWIGPGHAMAQFLQKWTDELREKTDGRLDIQVFPGGQLGSVQEHYDLVRRGTVDIGWILHGITSDRFPLTSLIDLPYTVDSAVHGTKILNDPEMRGEYLDAEHRGVKVLFLFTHQPAHIHTVSRAINTPEDLNGLRIRFPSATARTYLQELGATPVGIPPTAIAENLQKNVIDGVMIDYGGAGIAFKLGGLLKHSSEIGAYVTSFAVIMNPDSYAKLPDDLKTVFDESLLGREDEIGKGWDGLDVPGKKLLVDGGSVPNVPDETGMQAFRAVGAKVTEQILAEREAKGIPARAAYKKMQELAEKHRK